MLIYHLQNYVLKQMEVGISTLGGDITSAQLLQLIAIAANSHSNIKRQMYAWSAAVSRISGIYPNSMAGLC